MLNTIKRKIKDLKLRYKLFVIYIVAGFIPILVILLVTVTHMRTILRKNDTDNLNAYMYQATNTVDGKIAVYNNLFNYISFNQTIAQILNDKDSSVYSSYINLTEVLDPMLYSLKTFHNEVNQVTIFLNQDIIKHGTTLAPVSEIYDMAWYKTVLEDNYNHWYADLESGKAFSAGKMAILDRIGLTGILYIDVDYEMLFEPFKQNIFDNYGVIITDSNGNAIFEQADFTSDNIKYKLSFDKFIQEKNNANSKYQIISEQSTLTGWTVWVYKPYKLMISSVTPIVTLALVALALSTGSLLLSMLVITRFVTRRITYLQKNMMLVEKGDFSIAVENDSNDEIGDLISGFGSMLQKINSLINEVYESRLSEKEYEMKALQAQINPHFLYNTLSLINWKAIEANEQDISRITLLLSTFYRTALNKGKNVMTIKDEIDNMRSYLSIQLMMHDNDFDVDIDVDDNILQYNTLNLILQPLIENAIDHGIDVNETRRGHLIIRGYSVDDEIELVVEDNGIGMTSEQADRILTVESKGYGVRNVNERIKLYFGDQYALRIVSVVDEGTKVYVRFPKF